MGQLTPMPGPTPAVTVVGSLNLDLVVTVDRLPGRGETVVGRSTVTGPGGKGGNQAAAAGALSSGVVMVGRVGDDSAGRRLVKDLEQRGVDTATVLATEDQTTGTATVAVEVGSGENLIVVAPGANAALSPADVDRPAVRRADVLLLQLEIPLATVLAAVALTDGLVVLNPAPPQTLSSELLARVDVLVPNEWELAQLAGVDGKPREPAELAALARQVTSGDVVVTMGGRGALVVTAGSDLRAPLVITPPPVTPVDTTGAGDCFCGALCVALGRGDSLTEAVRFAVTAAALSTTAAGARGLLPDAAAVQAALALSDHNR
jgi:ribokinase